MKSSKKRKRVGAFALVLAGILALGGSMAYFTDRASVGADGTAGSLDISVNSDGINLLDKDGLNILNPKDLRQVNYSVTEEGNKSVDVRETIMLSAKAADGKTITMTSDKPIIELYDTAYPADGVTIPADAKPVAVDANRVVDPDKHSVTYHPAEYTLSGNPDKGDYEADGTSNVMNHLILTGRGQHLAGFNRDDGDTCRR